MHKWLIFSTFVVYYNHAYINPLEQVRNLCATALRSQKSVKASFVSFFMDAMVGVLTISGRMHFLQLARYCKSCEQRFRQNFRKTFDWIAFNRFFVDKHPGHRYAIAIDPRIEFLFRDAKQLTGLCHCQARDTRALDFAFNLSLAAINVAKAFCRHYNLNFFIADLKLLMHNAMMIERFLSMFGNLPNVHKNQGLKEHYFKDILLYGLKASA